MSSRKLLLSMLDELIVSFSHGMDKRIGFIFMGGSFNPIHSQHIQIMVLLKKYFENKHNIKIIGGYFVPTTDKYVNAKLKNEAIPFIHRKKLIDFGVHNIDWLHSSEYAIASSIQYLQKEILTKYPNALMINAMGSDKIFCKNGTIGKWTKYSKNIQHRKCLTVCLNRRGFNDNAYKLYQEDVRNGFVDSNAFIFVDVKDLNLENMSSTMVRNVLKMYLSKRQKTECVIDEYKKKLHFFMNDYCVDYLLKNIDAMWKWRYDHDDCVRDAEWNGFGSLDFGLEMQRPWSECVLSGRKQIETRTYPLPNALMNRKIDILETEKGIDGVSGLNGNVFEGHELHSKICRKGWIVIDKVIKYENKAQFERDEHKHLVPSDGGYGWKDGKTKVIYGWNVKQYGLYKKTKAKYKIIRRLRSLFEITSL